MKLKKAGIGLFIVALFIYICAEYISYSNVDLNVAEGEQPNSNNITILEAENKSLTYSYKYNIQLDVKNGYVNKIKLLVKEKSFLLLMEHKFTIYHNYNSIRLNTFKATKTQKRVIVGNVKVPYNNPEMANPEMTQWSEPLALVSTKILITNVEFMIYGKITASEIINSLNTNGQLFRITIK